MKVIRVFIPALIVGMASLAFAQGGGTAPKLGVIDYQRAIASTRDGQKALADLQASFAPKQAELEKKNTDIESMKVQLNKGSNAMSAEQREALTRQINQKTTSLNREFQDYQEEANQAQQKVFQSLKERFDPVAVKYAVDNGFTAIVDVGNVIWFAPSTEITADVVKLYDQNVQPPAATPSKPAASVPSPAAAPKSAPPLKKK